MDLFTVVGGVFALWLVSKLFRRKKSVLPSNESTQAGGPPALPLDVQPWERELLEKYEARIAFNKRLERARGAVEGPGAGFGGGEDEEMGPPPKLN